MLNDASVASLGFFKDRACTTRNNKEKSLKSRSYSTGLQLIKLVYIQEDGKERHLLDCADKQAKM